MRQLLLAVILLTLVPQAQAFSWADLWLTKNQQAQSLMKSGDYATAQETYDDPAWQATAAYRSGNYKDAATRYQSLKNNPDAFYNMGNTLAQGMQLEPAIKAYDKALAMNPNNQDALYNRKLVEELLKKEKEKQDNKDNKDKDKKDQNKQEQDKQNQDKPDHDKPDHDKPDHDKPDQDKPDQDKPDQDTAAEKNPQSQSEKEKQQAKEQWLRLIPDDPGGLMREKFLRDYLSRQRTQS